MVRILAAALATAGLLSAAASAAAQIASPYSTLPQGVPESVSYYEVAPGDTVSGIAQSFGITPETILWANGMSDGDLLKIGQKLTILPVSGVLHQVKAGESVLSIAASHGVEANRIVEANQIADPSLVREGDSLIVPAGTPTAAQTASASASGGEAAAPTVQHTVQPGDTLSSIAAAHGVQISTLQSANNLGNSDLLRVGQQLSIPGGRQAAGSEAQSGEAVQRIEASSRGSERDRKSFIANVTAYTIQGHTATGGETQWGVIAVDPRVIPLGSKVRIDGFEETFVAADTGGGVRGNWVDIYFPDSREALRFGIQSRRVTIVEP